MTGTILKWLGLITLCFVIQTTLVPSVAINGITPDLMLLALFLLGIRTSVLTCVYAGFAAGLCQDVYSPSILGQHALAMTVTGAFTGIFNERVMRTDPLMKFIILLVAFFIHDAIFTIVTIVKTDAAFGLYLSEIFTRTIPRAIYSISIAAAVYMVQNYLKPSTRH